jgi:hypothetical protein
MKTLSRSWPVIALLTLAAAWSAWADEGPAKGARQPCCDQKKACPCAESDPCSFEDMIFRLVNLGEICDPTCEPCPTCPECLKRLANQVGYMPVPVFVAAGAPLPAPMQACRCPVPPGGDADEEGTQYVIETRIMESGRGTSANVIACPKLTVLGNQTASVFLGEDGSPKNYLMQFTVKDGEPGSAVLEARCEKCCNRPAPAGDSSVMFNACNTRSKIRFGQPTKLVMSGDGKTAQAWVEVVVKEMAAPAEVVPPPAVAPCSSCPTAGKCATLTAAVPHPAPCAGVCTSTFTARCPTPCCPTPVPPMPVPPMPTAAHAVMPTPLSQAFFIRAFRRPDVELVVEPPPPPAVVPCMAAAPAMPPCCPTTISTVMEDNEMRLDVRCGAEARMSCREMVLKLPGCGSLEVSVREKQVEISCSHLTATADRLATDQRQGIVLAGHVELHCHQDGGEDRAVSADHACINLATGEMKFEMNAKSRD